MEWYNFFFFFFNDTATTEIYTLSLHDALPIYGIGIAQTVGSVGVNVNDADDRAIVEWSERSEEHTSELQSQSNLVCRLLLEKKKTIQTWNKTQTEIDVAVQHSHTNE